MVDRPPTTPTAEELLNDLLDDLLGHQLATEMFGPWRVVGKAGFANYATYRLEEVAKAIGWNDPGYWRWRGEQKLNPPGGVEH